MADPIQPGQDVTHLMVPPGTDVTTLMGDAPWQSRYAPAPDTKTSDLGTAAELKRYGAELLTGTGQAREQVKDYLAHEAKAFVPAAASAVTSLYQIPKAIYEQGPVATATGMGRGLVDTARGIAQGDPDAIGTGLGYAVAPKVGAAALRGVNGAATAVAEKPLVQHAIGTVGGALSAKAVGLSPFIGMGIGRAASGLLKGPAEDVAGGTARLMKILGMADPAPALSAAEVQQLVKQGYSPQAIEKIRAAAAAPDAPPSTRVPILRPSSPSGPTEPVATQPPPNVSSVPNAQPMGAPRVISMKPYTAQLRSAYPPATGQLPSSVEGWTSGTAGQGTAETASAHALHREDAALASRFKYLMDSRSSALLPGAVLGNALRKALLEKLGQDE